MANVEKLKEMLRERDAMIENLEQNLQDQLAARDRALARYREALEELSQDSEVAREALGEEPGVIVADGVYISGGAIVLIVIVVLLILAFR